jgi:Protein of unknown function (DUF3761)
MILRAALIATVIATVSVGWAAPSYGQAPIAGATTLPIAPVIPTDDECGNGWEWSKTANHCIPAPTAAPTAPPGATFRCVDGNYSYAKTSRGACSRHGGIQAVIGP